jgi:pimeloyl-ACP methyl ester carboxylesterase
MQLEHHIKQPVGPRKEIPLVLLHGAWHAAWCYDLWADEFAAHGYETHTFSLPAHGASEKTRSINLYGVGDYVNALAQIVDSIQPTPFVVAHSLGGYIFQRYLQSHTLPGGVLLCTLPPSGAIPFFLRYARAHPLRYLSAIVTLNLRSMVNTPTLAREYLVTDGAALSPDQLASRMGPESLRVAIECVFPILRPQKNTPLLVIGAESDGIFTVDEQKRTAQRYGSQLTLIPNQGHDLMIERGWQDTATKIREWLDNKQP